MSEGELEQNRKLSAAEAAAGRIFRVYERHCVAPDLDSFHDLLNALHSLNDRLEKAVGHDLHDIEEFIAVKVLRNFAYHQEEVRANVRVVPTPAQSDLMMMCVVRRDQVERAIQNVRGKWQPASRAACESHFHWYGDAVNINPCLFNLVVRVHEHINALGLSPPDEDESSLGAAYALEEEQEHSHLIDGRLIAHASDVEAILSRIVADLPPA